MGMCLPCLGGAADDVVTTPDPETRRRHLAEAAEKRQKEGILEGILRFLPKRRMPYFVDSKKNPPLCTHTHTQNNIQGG
ncbi:small VCP/p97-interacting protein isoform X3 [Takifugu flavidus]|uniref:small VCP/p97-interacting protein isoform X3 n=1 Tax=Takifugu flavidus TaxID=433684 RepID=UPI002544D0F5|nr:small VCP/p97-interacting protein isoform X3 [Takifugu flavidus]